MARLAADINFRPFGIERVCCRVEILAQVGLSARGSHYPSQLSGGEQQRVAVARALINDPKYVFADEPSGNLDAQTSEELHEIIFGLRDKLRQSFVIVTHNEELAKMSDRSLMLQNGSFINN